MMDLQLVMRFIFSPLIAFLVTFYIVPLCGVMAKRLAIVDIPDGRIKTHRQAVPYLGGVAIYIGFITSLAIVLPFNNLFLPFLLGATILLFLGFIDDILIIRPYQKAVGQLIAALCFFKAGIHLRESFFIKSSWTIPLSLFWIILVTNAFNLIDVMDGLATSVAFWVSLSFTIIAILFNQYHIAFLLSALTGALAAFFWYNKPNAVIYLGDAGSLFLGGAFIGNTLSFSMGSLQSPWSYSSDNYSCYSTFRSWNACCH